MTLEQARQAVRDLRRFVMDNCILPKLEDTPQEPCEDAISRKAMLDVITEIDDNINMDIYTNEVREIISALPSVIHTHKKGKWIKTKYWYSNYCSECNYKSEEQTNYCPNCGSRMEEPNKSEIPTGSDDYISAESESKRYMELAKSYAQGHGQDS